MELLIGCGHNREKRLGIKSLEWEQLTTLDCYPDCIPDVIHDLNQTPWPFHQDSFTEVHAYEVLEHLGRQGDAKSFFDTFSEIHRILKPDGHLFATTPSVTSRWLWGDPSHTRAIQPESMVFLQQEQYRLQLDGPKRTPMSDFRHLYKADFRVVHSVDDGQTFTFILQAIK
jgi:SAM-dependent methyltransferase